MAGFLPMWSPIHSNIGDGSNLWDTAIQNQARASNMLNTAIDTIRTNQQNSANAALLQAYQKALANGATPDEARASAAAVANPFVTADTLSNMFQNSRYDTYSNTQKAQEDRAAKDWQGQNEAAKQSNLVNTMYLKRDKQGYNQSLDNANAVLSDIALKYFKAPDLNKTLLDEDNTRLNMANTRQGMAERAQRMKLAQEALTGSDLIAETRAAMADSGEDPRSSTYGAIFKDTLNKIAAAKGIKNPSLYVAKLAPEYLPYITQGNIYDKGKNLEPYADISVNTENKSLDNATNFTDNGSEDLSLARGMAKGGAVLSAARAQTIRQALKQSGAVLTKEGEAKLANLSKNPKATAQDFNDFLNQSLNDTIRTTVKSSDTTAGAAGLFGMIKRSITGEPEPVDKGSLLKFIKFTDSGSGIESTAKTEAEQNVVNDFMGGINAAKDQYNQRVNDSTFLQNNNNLAKKVAFNIDPTALTPADSTFIRAQVDAADTVYQNQIDAIVKNYDSVLAKVGNAKDNFDPLKSALNASAKDYGQSEEQLAKQLGYNDNIPKFREKYTAALNKAKELGATDAAARIAIQMLIDGGKFKSKTFTPDWWDSDFTDAVKVAMDTEAKAPGILTRLSTLGTMRKRNELLRKIFNAKAANNKTEVQKLQQQLQWTYSKEVPLISSPQSTSN
jgi:hypothetical protein